MWDIRKALLLVFSERYVVLAISFAVLAIVSRLLTPEEIGFSVLGASVLAIGDAFRDFGGGSFIVAEKDVSRERVRTSFTVTLASSALIAAIMVACSGAFARLYGEARLSPFLQIIALSYLAGGFATPILALLRRDMNFRALAIINVSGKSLGALVTIGLVVMGFSFVSFAWGGLAGAVLTLVIALFFQPSFWIFSPRFNEWRDAVSFGAYNSAVIMINRIYDAAPYFIIGRVLPVDAVGLYSRSMTITELPKKTFLNAIWPIALPALAAHVRDGKELKQPYLRALQFISGVQWPALILVAFLAHPLVRIILGDTWLSIVPLVQIMAMASLIFFAAPMTYPVLTAAGRIRDALISSLISLPICAAIIFVAAFGGVTTLALSLFITYLLQIVVALFIVRRHVGFEWRELAAALKDSAVVAVCTAIGPAGVVLLGGHGFALPLIWALAAGLSGGAGWLAAICWLRHPLVEEVERVLRSARARFAPAPRERGASNPPGSDPDVL